jgi:2-polyprenyl-3-methyl-5-hydroxy-6-metoxy-1,4-benzoquinol methylase
MMTAKPEVAITNGIPQQHGEHVDARRTLAPRDTVMTGEEYCRSKPIYRSLLAFLRCPDCSGHLKETNQSLACQACRRLFPRVNGIVQFVPSEDYAGNFGFEWSKYSRTQLDREGWAWSEEAFRLKTGFSPEEIRGKWVLDVGCGMGRFAEVASRWGANVVGIDLSRAAEVAAHNLAHRDNVWICRTDLRRLPFALESFDYIYSIGVLHHTPDCKESFKGLVPFLKPGGTIAIWVYSAYDKWYRMSDVYRKLTTRLSASSLHTVCRIVDSLYYAHVALRHIPAVGRYLSGILNYLVPIPLYSNRELRTLDSFDWYSPKYQSKHTYEEVFRWLEECGLRDLRVLFQPVAVRGAKRKLIESA